ncbi:serine protease inhibitor 88Ea-like [Oratosquilla oratoria]|uniref:serine protease inhibitor 88Ea-like n=1 Tax=Oratosquilla oratoria TaxID=337810 RepID=UPI003F770E5A
MMKNLALVLLHLVIFLIGSSSSYPSKPCPPDNFDRVNVTFEDIRRTSSFGLDLFKKIKTRVPGKNMFFSSYSIWNALAIAYFGAEGKTLDELQNVLRLGKKDKGYKTKKLLSAELSKNVGVELDEVNRAYIADSLVLEKCFRSGGFYDVYQVDFSDPAKLAREINGLVSNTTRGLITEIVRPEILRGAPFFLANAIYFKGSWQEPFSEYLTQPREFFCSPGVACGEVQMMDQDSWYNYGNDTHLGAEVLELPYLNSSISMLLFLPWEGSVTVDDVVDRLDLTALDAAIRGLEDQRVRVFLPKFKMEQTLDRELQKALEELGIIDYFSTNANLSAFSKSLDVDGHNIIHTAVVEVNEKGTEAAAATVIFAFRTSPPRVTFNRPFVFLILDKNLGLPLFSGIYRSPPA